MLCLNGYPQEVCLLQEDIFRRDKMKDEGFMSVAKQKEGYADWEIHQDINQLK